MHQKYSDDVWDLLIEDILKYTKTSKQCRCGGAFIEVGFGHQGPVNCGETQCSVLPPLPTADEARTSGLCTGPNLTPGDIRAALDRATPGAREVLAQATRMGSEQWSLRLRR
jgi:hypothetical protein